MQKIRVQSMDGTKTFDFPFEWIESTELVPELNDLEAKAERGITDGMLYRVRQARIPSMKLKVLKPLTQAQVFPLLQILDMPEFNLTYFEKYSNAFKTVKAYAKKPTLAVRTYPDDNNTNNILYEPFEIIFTAYGGI